MKPKQINSEKNSRIKTFFAKNDSGNQPICPLCFKNHLLSKCSDFLKLNEHERYLMVKKHSLCIGCLKSRHQISNCRSKQMCNICSKNHNTLLHRSLPRTERQDNFRSKVQSHTQTPDTGHLFQSEEMQKEIKDVSTTLYNEINSPIKNKKQVLLSTSIVYIEGHNKKKIPIRIILDNGSECNFLEKEIANLLNLQKNKCNINISGINGKMTNIKYSVRTVMSNKDDSFRKPIEFLITPKITEKIPSQDINIKNLNLPLDFELADSEFWKKSKINALVGAEFFYEILKADKCKIGKFTFQNSVFGHIATGTIDNNVSENIFCGFTACNDFLDENIQDFGKIENIETDLRPLNLEEAENYPKASEILLYDTYMDDIISGEETLESTKELQKQLINLLKCAGMNLHKWNANHFSLLDIVSKETLDEYTFSDKETKALGVAWKPNLDAFTFKINFSELKSMTKRSILSDIARIFDPLGLIGPVIVKAKLFMQELWKLKLDWNDPIPIPMAQDWLEFSTSLKSLEQLKVNRYVLIPEAQQINLHGFSDASSSAFGAAVYIQSIHNSKIISNLLSSKSQVAPLKTVSIPRLELSGCVLLSKLVVKILKSLRLKTDIIDNDLWWHGPHFLRQETYETCNIDLPNSQLSKEDKNLFLTEMKETSSDDTCKKTNTLNCLNLVANLSKSEFYDNLFSITNDFMKLIRIFSFIFRFIRNVRSKGNRVSGPLSSSELMQAEFQLVKQVQRAHFSEQVNRIERKKTVTGKLSYFNPILDSQGLLRMGGRLENASLNYDKRHPLLLPPDHKLSSMIMEYYHKKFLHVGPQTLLYHVRKKYWIISGRSLARKICRNCITCYKQKPIMVSQLMGNLPKERVNVTHPFFCTGTDFCGPFVIKYPGQRKGIYNKIFVCIFVCLPTKAVHLELVSDLTSDAFIATLKRFFARRGKAQILFSDNATNFVSANKELKRLHKLASQPDENLANFLISEGITWKFLPPRAPNFGGLWEAGVKSFKYHLKRAVGNAKLTYEEFLTVVCQIEGILNSRPLTPLSEDIEDLEVLTPGHFLVGRPITAVIEPEFSGIPDNRLDIWQKLTKIIQGIWKKWQNNYLNTLQQRTKWRVEKENVKIGDMVLLKEENLPVCGWVLGRIVETISGKDSKIRVVQVKTKNGIYKRPISKIALLPLEDKGNN